MASYERTKFLAHHGILGQKWGIRRFQNKDGSLTSEGKKRYDSDGVKKQTSAMQAIDDGAKKYETPKEKIEAVTGDCWLTPSSYFRGPFNRKERERIRESAALGINALRKYIKNKGYNADDLDDPYDEGTQLWFLYEDQTIGLAMVADLINNGYSAKQINKLCKIVDDSSEELGYDYDGFSQRAEAACFEINAGNGHNIFYEFAKCCEAERDKK